MGNTTKRVGSILLSVLLLAVPIIGWLQREAIFEVYRLHNYQPPAEIAQLATDGTMTDSSRRMFYAYHPQLEDKETFNTHCSDSEKTIVLGCYIMHRGVYLYRVTDPRLEGVEQVTAAHEMLHAAYDRLSPSETKRVNTMISEAYATVTDQRIRDTIADYQKAGADTTNELHSILGTEARNLPAPLEEYYKRYFKDRLKVVSFSERYEAAFSERQAQADQYAAQLNSLKQQIDSLNSELVQQKAALDSQYNQLQSERSSTNDVQGFNAKVQAFNASVASYNRKVAQVSTLIDRYNAILDKYQSLVGEEKQLYKAIDSRPSTVQGQ